jgi:hypothetical protein
LVIGFALVGLYCFLKKRQNQKHNDRQKVSTTDDNDSIEFQNYGHQTVPNTETETNEDDEQGPHQRNFDDTFEI